MGYLNDHLLIENKIVRIEQERHFFQDSTAKRAVSGMILRQMKTKYFVLHPSQRTITQEFPPRHTLGNHVTLQQSRAEDNVGPTRLDGGDNVRQQSRVVLVIGMKHDDNVRSSLQGLG